MTTFLALSGTSMRRSIRDFAHILRWCLKNQAPVPSSDYETDEWALALDEKVGELDRKEPGALAALCPEIHPSKVTLEDVRAGFRRRLLQTPGVVSTTESSEDCEAALYVRPLYYDMGAKAEAHFKTLRESAVTPAGWPCSEAVEIWRHAREMALGLCYTWSPFAPDDWLEARREWASFVRATLSNNSRRLDSELQVTQAVDAGLLPKGKELLKIWRELKPTFVPNPVPVWFDEAPLKAVKEWSKEPGLIWVSHQFFGDRLAKETGLPYYGPKGRDAKGNYIEDADPKRSAIVSLFANREGRNLQEIWNRMLYTALPEGADVLQQSMARLHRDKQPKDEVEVWIMLGCIEHHRALNKALETARVVLATTGADNKLLSAEVDWPDEDELPYGARWDNK